MMEFVMERFKANIFSKDMMKMHVEPSLSLSIPRRRHLSHPQGNEVIKSEWSRLIPSQGG
jgi:hypothetical protein